MKKLEEILNLPESKKTIKKAEKEKADEVAQPFLRDMSEFDKISAALPAVKGLGDASDSEFDALAQRATDAYDDLMDLGMIVEARYSGRIFEVAGGMLKNAIDAKIALFESLDVRFNDLSDLTQMALEQKDQTLLDEMEQEFDVLVIDAERTKIELLLSGQHDSYNCFIDINDHLYFLATH
jgi:hypothetical protein